MTSYLSNRVKSIKPSATLAMSAKAAELQAAGRDIISLTVGEPDFATPKHIQEAAVKAIHSGFTKYTPVAGFQSLRQAVVDKFKRENNLDYTLNQILVSSGAKQSIYNLTQAILNEGDEVIIPAPYWVSYPEMILLAGATPVFISASLQQNFKITPEQLASAITPKTKLVMLNSPSNPTGVVYTKAELAALGQVLLKHPQLFIISDDIYEHILWTHEPFANIVNACPELYSRTIVINGVSKAYSMTGWRIGYAAGPEACIKAMANIQSQCTSNPCSISQKAAESALNSSQDCVREMVLAFKERHDVAVDLLNSLPGFECQPTDGAFYLFPRVEKAIKQFPGMIDDIEFSQHLLSNADVAVVPGSAFGMPQHIRLSIALNMETFAKAAARIKLALM